MAYLITPWFYANGVGEGTLVLDDGRRQSIRLPLDHTLLLFMARSFGCSFIVRRTLIRINRKVGVVGGLL